MMYTQLFLLLFLCGLSAAQSQEIRDSLTELQHTFSAEYTHELKVITYLNSALAVYLKKNNLSRPDAEILLQQSFREQKKTQVIHVPADFISPYAVRFNTLEGTDPYYFDRTLNTIHRLDYLDTIADIFMWKEVENARDLVMLEMTETQKLLESIQRLNADRHLQKRFIKYCRKNTGHLILQIRSFMHNHQ